MYFNSKEKEELFLVGFLVTKLSHCNYPIGKATIDIIHKIAKMITDLDIDKMDKEIVLAKNSQEFHSKYAPEYSLSLVHNRILTFLLSTKIYKKNSKKEIIYNSELLKKIKRDIYCQGKKDD